MKVQKIAETLRKNAKKTTSFISFGRYVLRKFKFNFKRDAS